LTNFAALDKVDGRQVIITVIVEFFSRRCISHGSKVEQNKACYVSASVDFSPFCVPVDRELLPRVRSYPAAICFRADRLAQEPMPCPVLTAAFLF